MRILLLTALLLLVLACSVSAQEIAIREARTINWNTHHIRTPDNCEIVLWEDTLGGDQNIYAQKINSSGQMLWQQPLPIVLKPGRQTINAVVPSSDNNFIIMWEDGPFNSPSTIWVQKFTSNGQILWPAGGIRITDTVAYYYRHSLVPNANGGAYVFFRNIMGANILLGQNLDGWGNQLWQAGGAAIHSFSTYFSIDAAVRDGSGGAIVNVKISQAGNHLLRVSPSGEVIGNNPMLAAAAFPGGKYSITPGVGGEFILFSTFTDYENVLYLHKMDNSGNLLLPGAVNTGIAPVYYGDDAVKLQCTPDGGLVIIWNDVTDTWISRFMIQKLDASFAPLWTPGGIEICSGEYLIIRDKRLSVHANGKAWISWILPQNNDQEELVMAQHFDSSGTPQWAPGGMQLSIADRWVQNPVCIAFADRAMFLWQEYAGAKKLIRRQLVSTGGALYLAQGGLPVVDVLNGLAVGGNTIAMNDKYFSAWIDTRSYESKIYYQISYSDLNPQLEANGRALNLAPGDDFYYYRLIGLPDNSVAILYSTSVQNVMKCYLQKIDNNGAAIYPDRGILIASGSFITTSFDLSYSDGDIYIGWNERISNASLVKGQRVSGGQKMWGENGIVIASHADNGGVYFFSVRGRYFLWKHRLDEMTSDSSVKALLMNANGYPQAGWNAAGVFLLSEDNIDNQVLAECGLIGDDLIVFISFLYTPNVFVQKISSAGTREWGDNGIALGANLWVMDAVYDEAVTFVYMFFSNAWDLRLQKISSSGTLLYPQAGNLISSELESCNGAVLLKYASGKMTCYWSENSLDPLGWADIFIRHINPQGQAVGHAPIVVCDAPYDQRRISAAVIGENAMLSWTDDRVGVFRCESFVSSIMAIRISSFPVDNDDEYSPPAALPQLYQNYPNPFNPVTTIAFDLVKADTASLKIYNLKGQLVKTLLKDSTLNAGNHSILWDGLDEQGRKAASGIYLYRLSTSTQLITKKMVLAK
ncbi:MAG: T9SS type A sorting domain-containing protein [Candidatus Cloacimonadaceae bacterium]|nr:T9SS type A sorting domain-containing protein [Candidatus Cloacimonadaceae bacterium]